MTYLENEYIRLRALEPEDLDILYKWENDTELWRYGNTIAPFSRFTLREHITGSGRDLYQERQLRLMICSKEEGICFGTVDLYDFDPMHMRMGVGLLIDEPHRQKGIGYQVLELIKNYAFDFLFIKQLYAYVPKRNLPSMKLFTRAGYKHTGRLHLWTKTSEGFDDVFIMQLINYKLKI